MGEAGEGRRWHPNGMHSPCKCWRGRCFYNRDGGGADRDGDHVMLEPGGHTNTITEEGWPLHRCHHLPAFIGEA